MNRKLIHDKPPALLVIANLNAGSILSGIETVKASLSKLEIPYVLVEVSKPEQAIQETKKGIKAGSFAAIAAYGGDGTVVAVAKTLAGSKVPMLVLPAGTANIFAKSLQLPSNIDTILTAYQQRLFVERYVQTAAVGDESLLLDMHTGIVSNAVQTTPRALKKAAGSMAYTLNMVRWLKPAQKQQYVLELDDTRKINTEGYALFIVNSSVFSLFGQRIVPKHKPDQLAVFILRKKNPARLFVWYAARLVTGRNLVSHLPTFYCRSVRIVKAPAIFYFDDTPKKVKLPVEITMQKTVLRVIKPISTGKTVKSLWKKVQTFTVRNIDQARRSITGIPSLEFSHVGSHLYLGGQYKSRALSEFEKRGIKAVVSMRTFIPKDIDKKHGITVLHLPTTDMTAPKLEDLQKGAEFMKEFIDKGQGVYVHCRLGEGRGPTMAAAYLISAGMRPEDAIAHLQRYRPFARPNKKQRQRLIELYELLQKEPIKPSR